MCVWLCTGKGVGLCRWIGPHLGHKRTGMAASGTNSTAAEGLAAYQGFRSVLWLYLRLFFSQFLLLRSSGAIILSATEVNTKLLQVVNFLMRDVHLTFLSGIQDDKIIP
uniref:Uncharacterized protein n=1 Tax=Picea sitchensis TaxID=3332 RepID=A9NMB9_PICSI|nr:unknown [Picea sitchensis]